MKRTIIFIILFIFQTACSAQSPPPAGLPIKTVQQESSTQSPTGQDIFQVTAWVDDPDPALNSRIVVRGSLIKNGRQLNGLMMQGSWPDESHEPGVANCSSQVIYGTGRCVIDVSRFPPGKFVPVTVTINYMGKTYSAQTGFIPQEP